MNIVIIDNGTTHLKELQSSLKNHEIFIIKKNQLMIEDLPPSDLIILSGSNHMPIVKNPMEYETEINLVKTITIPILGICMGFEIIAYAFGGKLKEMPQQEHGVLEIFVTNSDDIFKTEKMFRVEERHRWVVTEIKSPLIDLATSKDGVEAVKHQSKAIYGFQFHPEIFDENEQGHLILNNLLEKLNNKQKLI